MDACPHTEDELQYSDLQVDEPIDKTLFVHNCALFFLRWQRRCFVPLNTIESIATELHRLQQLGLAASMNALKVRLLADRLPVEQIDDIISEIKNNDVFRLALDADKGTLRSEHKRTCFYKENLRYVEPVQKVLGQNTLCRLSICQSHHIRHINCNRSTCAFMVHSNVCTIAKCLPGYCPIQERLHPFMNLRKFLAKLGPKLVFHQIS